MGTFSVTTDSSISSIANKTGLRTGCSFQRSITTGVITDSNHNLLAGSTFYIKENSLSGNSATWTRSGTVATVTFAGHGFSTNSTLRVTVSSSTSAITLGTKTVTGISGDTFTFTCLNAGSTSGTLTYDNVWIDEGSYTVTTVGAGIVSGVSWSRSSTTITVTSSGHGMSGAGNTIYLIDTSDSSATPLGAETITVVNTDTFTFTGVASGGTSGTLSYIRTNNLGLTAPSTIVATCLNAGTNYTGTVSYTSRDIYNISNGATLTIDTDSRYGANQTLYTVLGTVALSGTNSRLLIDGRNIRLIQYDSGSGTLPALDSTVTQGASSGKLIGVWSSLTSTPTTSGSIPASGYIKIREWNGVPFSSGALTLSGITANSTGADVAGWIDVSALDRGAITGVASNRLEVLGEWYSLGTTDGSSSGQSFQLPTSGQITFTGAIFVETAVGSNEYEPYPSMGSATTAGTEPERGKVCWVDTTGTGIVSIGKNNSGTASGYVPASGLNVVIGNVFLSGSTVLSPEANVSTDTTVANRFNIETFIGNVICNKGNSLWCWYYNLTNAMQSIRMDYWAQAEYIYIGYATKTVLNRCGIGSVKGNSNAGVYFNASNDVEITDSSFLFDPTSESSGAIYFSTNPSSDIKLLKAKI